MSAQLDCDFDAFDDAAEDTPPLRVDRLPTLTADTAFDLYFPLPDHMSAKAASSFRIASSLSSFSSAVSNSTTSSASSRLLSRFHSTLLPTRREKFGVQTDLSSLLLPQFFTYILEVQVLPPAIAPIQLSVGSDQRTARLYLTLRLTLFICHGTTN